jgi:glycosyltransferase involved in cell wall biosynthesis
VHAASRRDCKGTRFAVKAVDRLINDGHKIDFSLIENTPHSQAMERYAKADIALDQFLIGAYGTFAIEMMALGKPVISYIRNGLYSRYGNPPILNANIDNLHERIKSLVEDEALRVRLGREGREYIKKVHDSKVVAKRLEGIYSEIG